MLEIRRHLDERYRTLRDSRNGPIYFVEHGLGDREVLDVITEVGDSLNMHPLESTWWNLNSLPLLVAAAEVGYRYHGTGTDFWPVLEAELGVEISATNRQRIRDLFARASKIYRGAQPPATPWARAFRLIAWPITHALVPIEFHRPLSLTLGNLRVNVGELNDNELYRAIQMAAANASARFSTLLDNSALVVAVIRTLLGDDNTELCQETMERIATDLTSDQVNRRAVAVARRVQRTDGQHKTRPSSPQESLPTITGAFYLRRRDNTLSLEAVFPLMEAEMRANLRRILRRRRYAARLWGVSAPVPSIQLLSGLPFTVKLTKAPSDEAELLLDLDKLDIDPKLRDILANFKLDIRHPMVFAVSSDQTRAWQIRGPNISGNRKYWLLCASGEGPPGCATLGEVGPYDCYLLDPAEETAQEVLRELGFYVRFGVSIEFAGMPPLELDAPIPVFAVGDERIVVPRQVPQHGLDVQVENEKAHLTGDDVATIVVEQGEHTLWISNRDEGRDFTYRGTLSPQPAPPATCSIEPRSADLTVQALLRGPLDFAIESPAPLEGLELTVVIRAGDRELFATAPLAPLPCKVSSEQEPFATLLDDETRTLLVQTRSLGLRLSVGNLCTYHMRLEQRVRPCWWQRSADGKFALVSEIGQIPFGGIPATAPLDGPASGSDDSLQDARLLAPIDLDVSEHGPVAQFTTICIAPSEVGLDAPTIPKPRLARSRISGRDAPGLEKIVESYLRWSLAETPTVIAEILRRQIAEILDGWITETCCGEEWVRRETHQGYMDPWDELLRICDETGFGRDSYIELSRNDQIEVTRLAIRQIRLELPDLWVRAPSNLSPEDYETLDVACGDAYTALADMYRKQGKENLAEHIGEGDPGAAQDEWDSVLGRIKTTVELLPLCEMLHPSDIAFGLMTLEPSIMTLDELTEEFAMWAGAAGRSLAGKVPPADSLNAILALWIEPEIAASVNWRHALDVLLAERTVARAGRYLALRSGRLIRRGSLH